MEYNRKGGKVMRTFLIHAAILSALCICSLRTLRLNNSSYTTQEISHTISATCTIVATSHVKAWTEMRFTAHPKPS